MACYLRFIQSLLSDDLVPNIPILVLGNKTDLKKAVGQDELIRIFGVNIYLTGKVGHKIYYSGWFIALKMTLHKREKKYIIINIK